jgi:branched-subunit amino acid ABC-type transport system permease component
MTGAYLIPVVDGLAYGLLLFTVSAGLTLSFGVGGVLNLAHGTTYTAGAYLAVALGDGSWTGLLLAVAAATLAGAAAGGLLAVALIPVLGRGQLAQALLTFGIALAAGGLLIRVFGADDRRPRVPAAADVAVSIGGHTYPAWPRWPAGTPSVAPGPVPGSARWPTTRRCSPASASRPGSCSPGC